MKSNCNILGSYATPVVSVLEKCWRSETRAKGETIIFIVRRNDNIIAGRNDNNIRMRVQRECKYREEYREKYRHTETHTERHTERHTETYTTLRVVAFISSYERIFS